VVPFASSLKPYEAFLQINPDGPGLLSHNTVLLIAYLEQPNRATRALSCANTVPAGHIRKRQQSLAPMRDKLPNLT
jgi:hypothetical protein